MSACDTDRSNRGRNAGQGAQPFRISGVLQAGPVSNATVRAFKVVGGVKGDSLGETRTGPDQNGFGAGEFALAFAGDPEYAGPVLLEATGGTFFDEATRQSATLVTSLRVAIPNVTKFDPVAPPGAQVTPVTVTPLTTLQAELATRGTGGLTQVSAQAAFDTVNAIFNNAFDAKTTSLVDMTQPATGSVSGAVGDYTLVVGAFSQLAVDLGLDFNELMDKLVEDVRDGALDGQNLDTDTTTEDSIATRLARALVTISGSQFNKAGLNLRAATLNALAGFDGQLSRSVLPGIDTRGPVVSERFPLSGSTGVGTDARVFVRFDEPLNGATVTATNFSVRNGSAVVPGAVSYDDRSRTAVFTPSAPLPANATLTVLASTGLSDLGGSALREADSFTFTTGAAALGGNPTLVSLTPVSGTTDVGLGDAFVATFDRALDPRSLLQSGSVTLLGNGLPLPINVGYSLGSTSVVLVPALDLGGGTAHSVNLQSGILDVAGNALLAVGTTSFSTVGAGAVDSTPPTVLAVDPATNSTNADSGTSVRVSFSEQMRPEALVTAVQLFDGATPVPGRVRALSRTNTAEFVPSSPLTAGRTYTVAVNSGAQDASGNGIATPFSSDFTVTDDALRIATLTLPAATVGQSYDATILTTGGTPPVSFALAAGDALPAGLSLSTDGRITGVPSAPGAFDFTVEATDSQNGFASQAYTLNVVNQNNVAVVAFTDAASATANEATATFLVTVTLSTPTPLLQDLSATVVESAAGNAISGADYDFTSQVVRFPAGAADGATQSVSVGVKDDTIFERDETLVLTLTNPVGGALGALQSHTVTITDDDPVPTLSLDAVNTLNEGVGVDVTTSFSVTLSNPTVDPVSVPFTVTGTALNPADHDLQDGSFDIAASVIEPGNTTASVSFTVRGDNLDENDETITITLGAAQNAVVGVATQTLTIVDQDPLPTLSIDDVTVTEGAGGGTTIATFTVSLNVVSGRDLAFDFVTVDGTGTASPVAPATQADYQAATGSRTIAAGATTATVEVTVNGDDLNEIDETFSVELQNPVNAAILDGSGLGTISNDDAVPTVTISSPSVLETDAGVNTTLSFDVTLSAPSGRPISLDFASADGASNDPNENAVAPQDYLAVSGGLSFLEGNPTTQTIDVTVVGDDIDEDTESFTVTLSNLVNVDPQVLTGTGTINDNENLPAVQFDIAARDLDESVGPVTLRVQLDRSSQVDITVPFSVNPGNTAVSPPDFSDLDVASPLARAYLSQNGAQTAGTLSALTPDGATRGEEENSHAVGNNEGVVLDLFGNLYQAGDVAGSPASIRIFRNASNRAVGAAFDANVDDILVGSNTGLVNPKGLDIDSGRGLLFVSDNGAVTGQLKVFRLSDVDDAAPQGTTTLGEQPWDLDYDSANDRLFVSTTSGNVLVFDDYVAGGFGPSGPTRTITPAGSVNLHGIVYNAARDELYLSDVGAAASASDGQLFLITGAAAASGTVTADVNISGAATELGNPVDLAFDGANLFVVEKANDLLLVYNNFSTATQSGATLADARVAFAAGTGPESLALDSGQRRDHSLVDGQFLIAAGTLEATVTFSLDDDNRREDSETLRVDLGAPPAIDAVLAANNTSQTITIIDDDLVAPNVSIEDVTVVETNDGQTATAVFKVRLDGASGQGSSVDFATTDGAADPNAPVASANPVAPATLRDYETQAGTLTFDEGEVFKTVRVQVNGDLLNEFDEQLTVTIANPNNQQLSRDIAVGTLTNDDALPTFSIQNVTLLEGQTQDFVVVLDAPSGKVLTVEVTSADGATGAQVAAVAGADYTALSPNPTTLTFVEGGATQQTVSVAVADDGINEADESFSVTIDNFVNTGNVAAIEAVGTIQDNDDLAISVRDNELIEGAAGQTSPLGFTIETDIPTEQTIDLVVATPQNGAGDVTEATSGVDFVGTANAAVLSPNGASPSSVETVVNILGDGINEVDQRFLVSISGPLARTQSSSVISIAVATATGTIRDDDNLTISIADDSVTETNADQDRDFLVTSDIPTEQTINILVAAEQTGAGDTTEATLGADILDQTGGVVTLTPNGLSPSQSATRITVVGDNINENDQSYLVRLSNPAQAVTAATSSTITLADAEATGSILDDDDAVISLSDLTVTEQDATNNELVSVSLSLISEQSPTVTFQTADGVGSPRPAAIAPDDYTDSSGTVTFQGVSVAESIVIPVVGDAIPELDESLIVSIANPTGRGVSIGVDTATVNIDDNDLATVDFTVGTQLVDEDDRSVTFTATLDGPRSQVMTVPFVIDASSSAENPADASDRDAQGQGAVAGYLTSNPAGGAPILERRGAGGVTEASYDVGNNGALALDTDGNLYQAGDANSGAASIRMFRNASNRGATATFDPGQDDIIVGANTRLENPTGLDVDTQRGLIFVADNGTSAAGSAPAVRVFRTADVDDVSPQGITTLSNNGATERPRDLDYDGATDTLYVSTSEGNVFRFDGYVADSFGQSGPAAVLSPTGAVSLAGLVHNASSDELYLSDLGQSGVADDGQLLIVSGASSAATGSVTPRVVIAGAGTELSDPVDIAWDGDDLTVAENLGGRVLVFVDFANLQSGAVAPDAALSFSVAAPTSVALDGGDRRDHDLIAGTLTYNPGETSKSVTFTLFQDLRNEPDETVVVDLDGAATTGPVQLGVVTRQTTTVVDNNAQPTVSVESVTVTEGNQGPVQAIFKLRLDAASGRAVSVDFRVDDGSATAATTDYTDQSGTVTFAEGGVFGQIIVDVLGDTRNELDETFTVALENPVNLIISTTDGVATGTILNDDDLPVALITAVAPGAPGVAEGASGTTATVTFTVQLQDQGGAQQASGRTVTVDFTTADLATPEALAGADYDLTSGQLTFLEGETEKTVDVTVRGDDINEIDERFNFTISLPSGSPATLGLATLEGIINDDDTTVLTLTGPAAAITEGSGVNPTATFTASLSVASEQTVTFTAATQNGTATGGGVDFVDIDPSQVFTFSPLTTSVTVPVSVIGDLLNEENQGFSVSISLQGTPNGVTTGALSAAATINDDDDTQVTLSVDNAAGVTEGGDQTFTVSLSPAVSEQDIVLNVTSVSLAATEGTDFTAPAATVTIPAGQASATITVTTTSDEVNEADEDYGVSVALAATPRGVSVQTGQASGLVVDDDPVEINLSLATPPAEETANGAGDAVDAVFRLNLVVPGTQTARSSEQSPTVSFSTADGSAVAPGDYSAVSGRSVSFGVGVTSQDVTVATAEDQDPEIDESYSASVALQGTPKGVSVGTASATATIVDSDIADVSFTLANAVFEEGSGQVTLTANLSGPKSQTITVPIIIDPNSTVSNPRDVSDIDTQTPIMRTYISQNQQATNDCKVFGLTPGTATVQATFDVGNNQGVILDTDGRLYQAGDLPNVPSIRVFANATDRGAVGSFDPTLDKIIIGSNTMLRNPKGIDVDTNRGLLFVADNSARDLKVFSTAAVGNTSPLGVTDLQSALSQSTSGPWDLDYDTTNDRLYVSTTEGTVLVFDDFVVDGFGQSGPARTITPTDATVQVSVNLHGIVYNGELDQLYLSDVGVGGVAGDGQLFIVDAASTASGGTDVSRRIQGAGSELSDPVDVAFDGVNLLVAEKLDDKLLTFNNFATASNNSPDLSRSQLKPESVAFDPGDRRDLDFTSAPRRGIDAPAFVFNPGDTTASFSFNLLTDTLFEGDEQLLLSLGTADPAGSALVDPARASFEATITNDVQTTQPTVSVSGPATAIAEGDLGDLSTATFTVTLDAASGEPVSVDIATVDGTALAGADYQANSATLTFAPGEVFKSFEVTVVGDVLDEVDETFSVLLSNNVQCLLGVTTAQATIQDNDGEPNLSFVSQSETADEEAPGEVAFVVQLDNPSGQSVTVDFATADGSATAGGSADYVAQTGTLTFAPGETQKTVTLSFVADQINEATESFTLELSNAVGANITVGQESATASISDNDDVSVSLAGVTVTEGDSGAVSADFVATLSGVSEQQVDLTPALADGTATGAANGGDFVNNNLGTQSIPAGALQTTISVSVNGDLINEADESFQLTVVLAGTPRGVTIAQGDATGTITDNDALTVSIEGPANAVTEGASGTTAAADFTVTLSRESEQTITVALDTADGSARSVNQGGVGDNDFTPQAATTVTFSPAVLTRTVTVDVLGDDVNEADEGFSASISQATGNLVSVDANADTASASILDDDDLSISVTLTTSGQETPSDVEFTATRDIASEQSIQLSFRTSDGGAEPAIAGTDYSAVDSTVTFAPSATAGATETIRVPVFADLIDEADPETFVLNVDTPVAVGSVSSSTLSTQTPTVDGTITDNDDPPVVSITDASVNESAGTATLTVTLDAQSGQTIEIDFSSTAVTAADGADFSLTAGTLTYQPTETVKTITASIVDDDRNEGTAGAGTAETFTVDLTAARGLASFTPISGTVTIDDNDPLSVTLDDVTVNENIAAGTATFTVNLGRVTEQDVTVEVTSFDVQNAPNPPQVSASARDADLGALPQDYVPLSAATQTVNGATTPTDRVSFTVTIQDDGVNEPIETFVVDITTLRIAGATANPGDGSGFGDARFAATDRARGLGSIVDNDLAQLSIDDVQVAEDASPASFTVSLDVPSEQIVVVDFQTADGTATAGAPADYTERSSTSENLRLIFQPLEQQKTLDVVVVDDAVNEADETLDLAISIVGTPDGLSIADGEGTATILDNDDINVVILGDPSVNEADGPPALATFNLRFQDPANAATLVSTEQVFDVRAFSRQDSALENLDFLTKEQIFNSINDLNAGAGEVDFTVEIIDDTLVEADETFTGEVVLQTNPAPRGVSVSATEGVNTATIVSDDAVEVVVNDTQVTEGTNGQGLVTLDFVVNLNAVGGTTEITSPVVVVLNTRDGQRPTVVVPANGVAPPTDDFQETQATLTFNTGTVPQTQTVSVTVEQDQINEATEEMQLFVSQTVPDLTTNLVQLGLNQQVAGQTLGLAGTGLGTILDDDTLTISIDDVTVTEGTGAGQTPVTFTVSFDIPSQGNITLDVDSSDGTALSDETPPVGVGDNDFVQVQPNTRTFLGFTDTGLAQPVLTQTVTVLVDQDNINEAEESFTVDLSSLVKLLTSSAATPTITEAGDVIFNGGGNTLSGTGTVQDDDNLEIVVADAADSSEGSGSSFDITFTVQSQGEVTVPVTLTSGSALVADVANATKDVTVTGGNSQNLVFAPGEQLRTVSFTVDQDTVNEPDQSFTAVLDRTTITTQATTAAGDSSAVDAQALTAPTPPPSVIFVGQDNDVGLATIVNDDDPINITVAADTATVAEGNATRTVSFTVDLLDTTTATEQSFEVLFSTDDANGNATADATSNGQVVGDNDFVAVSNRTVVTSDGSSTNQFVLANDSQSVTINGDTVNEADETFEGVISSAAALPAGVSITTARATQTLSNDDDIDIVLTGPGSVSEGGTFSFKVELQDAGQTTISDTTVTVLASTINGSATAAGDFTELVNVSVAIDPGQTEQTFTVSVNDELVNEADESFMVMITAPGAGLGGNPQIAINPADTVTVTIVDDDTVVLDLSVANAVDEGVNASFSVTNTGTATSTEQSFTVDFTTADGIAVAPGDYTAISNLTLTIDQNNVSATGVVTTLTDLLNEGDETFVGTISNLQGETNNVEIDGGGAVDVATQTLTDLNQVTVAITPADTTINVTETQAYTLTVQGTAGDTLERQIVVSIADDPNNTDTLSKNTDYTVADTVTIPAGAAVADTVTFNLVSVQTTGTYSLQLTFAGDRGVTDPADGIVTGRVQTPPVANDDSFMTAFANTLFGVGQAAPVTVTGSVLDNDTDADAGDTLTVTAATANDGAVVTMQTDGTFTYLPALNAVGNRTFTYTLSDGNGGTDTATVTIVVFDQRIIYVDADAPAGGDGRNSSPFNSLSGAAAAADRSNDIIYVFDDNLAGTTPGAITLLDGQQLLGNVDLIVNNTTIFSANGTPTLNNAGPIITLAVDNTIRGFNINPPTGEAITTAAAQATLGTLTVNTVSIAAAGGSGFVSVPTNATGNTLAVSLSSLSSTATTSPGLAISNCVGSFAVTGDAANTAGSGGTISNVTGDAVQLANATNISLEDMFIGNPAAVANGVPELTNNISGAGIISVAVTNLTLTRCLISETGGSGIEGAPGNNNLSISDCQFIDCGDTNADDALDYEGNANADQLTGTATLTNCTIADTFGEALVIENFATGTLDLTLENVMISAATGDAFATLVEQGTLNVSANNCTISNIQGAGIAFGLGTNATGTYIVTAADINSIGEAAVELESLGTATLTVTGTAAATITNCQDGILVIADGASTTVNLQDITINAVDVGIVFEHISGIFNSTIDTQTLANNSISGGGDAIEVTSGAGAGVDTSPRIQISNSQFASTNADGGSFKIDNTTSNNSVFHLTMDNNSFTGAVGCSLEMANASVFCANLTNNTFTGTTSDLALLNTNTNATQDSFLLDGFAGDGTDSAQVTTFLTATQNNTLTNNTIDFGGVVNFGRGTCLLPSP